MNKFTRALALCLAMVMILAMGLTAVAESSDLNEMVVLTIDGNTYSAGYVDEVAYQLYNYGYADTYPDYSYALTYIEQQYVIEKHLKDDGYLDFTDEELEAFKNEAAETWESYLNSYVEYYLSEDTAEARATLREQAIEYYAEGGYDENYVYEGLLLEAAYTRLEEDMNSGYTPTEEEITAIFNEYGAGYEQSYSDVAMFEFYTQYYGYESWYTPYGYRGVLQVLVEVDDELLNAYAEAADAYDAAEDEAAKAEAKAAMDAAEAAVIASKQDVIDDINARMSAVATAEEREAAFKALINDYNSDPGMTDPETLETGYMVHTESILYDDKFISAAFDENMKAIGDWSAPSVGSYGIYMVYYKSDIPGGLILTDEIREEISEYLVSEHVSVAYIEKLAEWSEGVDFQVNEENYNTLVAFATTQAAE